MTTAKQARRTVGPRAASEFRGRRSTRGRVQGRGIYWPCLVALAASCGGGRSATAPNTLTQLPTDFPITVSTGLTPSFSWTGGPAQSLDITDTDANTVTQDDVWEISETHSQAGFAGPVTYGIMPSAAGCGFLDEKCPNATPLIKGHVYLVVIITDEFLIGEVQFQP